MSKNLNRHIRSDKAKWAITGIVLVLIVVMLVGMCLQLFGQGKVKPSEWFKKQPIESGEVVEIDNSFHSVTSTLMSLSDNSDNAYPTYREINKTKIADITGVYSPQIVYPGTLFDTTYSKLHVSNNVDSITVSDFSFFILFTNFYISNGVSYLYLLIPRNTFVFSDYTLDSVSLVSGELADKASLVSYKLSENSEEYVDYFFLKINKKTNKAGYDYADVESYDIVFSFIETEKIVPLPPDPIKEGYTFTGWYLDEACTEKYTGTTVTADTVLYAGWKINTFTVTFDSNGGSTVEDSKVDWNTACTLITPTKEGYTFLGWYLSDGTQYINQPIKENTALTAEWEINKYIVIFDSDGGSTIENKTVDWNTAVECPVSIKEGHIFKGWFLSDGTQYTDQAITSNITLKAQWEIRKLSVAFDMNGADEIADQVVNYGESVILETPAREGYNFLGWFLSDGTEYTNQPIKENITIKANWEIKRFTVTFYVDGEIYNEMTVDYGTYLRKVADQAEVFSQNVISYRFVNADLPVGELGDMVVVDDMEVVANAPSESDKAIGTIKNNWLPIVLGGVGLVFVVAIISAVATRKKRR